MRAVNLRSENKGLAEAETGRRKSSCPDQKDRSDMLPIRWTKQESPTRLNFVT